MQHYLICVYNVWGWVSVRHLANYTAQNTESPGRPGREHLCIGDVLDSKDSTRTPSDSAITPKYKCQKSD